MPAQKFGDPAVSTPMYPDLPRDGVCVTPRDPPDPPSRPPSALWCSTRSNRVLWWRRRSRVDRGCPLRGGGRAVGPLPVGGRRSGSGMMMFAPRRAAARPLRAHPPPPRPPCRPSLPAHFRSIDVRMSMLGSRLSLTTNLLSLHPPARLNVNQPGGAETWWSSGKFTDPPPPPPPPPR